MMALGYIVIGAMALAVVTALWHAWRNLDDDWDDDGGPYL